jgi:cyclopropane-fatty-acyl-phospholipid synthase
MNTAANTAAAAKFSLPAGAPAAARTVLDMLHRLKHGSLSLTLPDGSQHRFGGGEFPNASLCLHNWKVCAAALKSGDIGFAEGYIDGDWSTGDLSALLRLFIANRREVEDVIYGTWLGRLVYRIRHLLHRNTRSNSQKNIHAHYDLGNAFYELWLDGTMNYSSALFESPDTSMQQAQRAKVARALRMTDVKAGDRVLEIGCGWGALAVTLRTEQLAWARARMERCGVAERVDLRLQDYRDIGRASAADGQFDAICSIEMIEAVGREYWPTYFSTVARLLKPGGKACIQSIVIADELFERYLQSTDFIQQYVFPGGCLPSPQAFREQARQAGLEVVDEFCFGQDYAETLRQWRQTFMAREQQVLALGFDQRFMRIWEFYLAYCEAAFSERNTDVVQYTLRKP